MDLFNDVLISVIKALVLQSYLLCRNFFLNVCDAIIRITAGNVYASQTALVFSNLGDSFLKIALLSYHVSELIDLTPYAGIKS